MQEPTRTVHEKAREIIIQNTQKGQLYRIEFADDPDIFEGIPIVQPDMSLRDDDMFEMRVVGFNHRDNVIRRSVRDIVWIEAVQ